MFRRFQTLRCKCFDGCYYCIQIFDSLRRSGINVPRIRWLWTDALALLRTAFGPLKTAHPQLSTGMLTEEIQLDMVYGLLNRKIREKVPRDEIKTFTELLTNSRLLEE
ncbi:hypothetical protein JTB14_029505 [Gonioctena quinquepunctata]|nr:hypothetical protein JTB14_029505 [Gonioctena quinquepunctata]